jgi:3-mercaptopyruvate sulfurtransferase SseA
MQLLELVPDTKVVVLTGGLITWYNAGAPMEDPDGNPVMDLHPFSDELAAYLLGPAMEEGEVAEKHAEGPLIPDEG